MKTWNTLLIAAILLVSGMTRAEREERTTPDDTDAEPLEETEQGDTGPEAKALNVMQALKEGAEFKVGASLYALWTMTDEAENPLHEFRLNMARIKFSWTQCKIVEAVLKLDTDQLIEGASATSILREMYVRVQPFTFLGVQMGQFKKPFSRIELRSRRRLPVIKRGIVNDYIVEHLMYGDRDIGLMVSGRIWDKIKLDYAVGIFNGMGMNRLESGLSGFKDVAARVDLRPVKWLSLGFSGSLRIIERSDLEQFVVLDDVGDLSSNEYPDYVNPENLEASLSAFEDEHKWMTGVSWMSGLDLGLKVGKFNLIAEAMLGENWWFKKYPLIYGATVIVSYRHRLMKGWNLWIQPVVMAEVLTLLTNWKLWRNREWQLSPGVNLHVGKYVRLMVGGEFTFTEGTEADIDGARYANLWPNEWPGDWVNHRRLLVQLAFSL